MALRSTLDFLLYDWLDVEQLTARARYEDHSRETFNAVLDTCERMAREQFAPYNRLVDSEEPRVESGRVVLPQATHRAREAYAQSGMLSAAQDYAVGGMQLPYVVESAANAFFAHASVSIGSNLLTSANANLLRVHGTATQQRAFAQPQFDGHWTGTMCLSEPQAGSSLSDIATRAHPDGDNYQEDALGPRYRLRGNKMWISSGDHEMTPNIVHLVLAKIVLPDGTLPPGVQGLSLFIVPKRLVDGTGQLTGERNDVALVGLNHKLGWRGTTNTLLNFGEGIYPVRAAEGLGGLDGKGSGAIGYLVGRPGEGLRCMFHMMNEARIAIGLAAAMLGMAGYDASLQYAKERLQGRPVGPQGKDPNQPPVPLIAHADIKRMLLAQKSYCEGALALNLLCAQLVDVQRTGSEDEVADARLLLEVLTPVAKSWPSEFCLEANSLAIQIHGGYGYTRDFPVEQYWRDNRLNMIHEGTHGIQAMDLLGRKVLMENGRGAQLLGQRIRATIEQARQTSQLSTYAQQLEQALNLLSATTRAAWATNDPAAALANAVPYMQGFGHVVMAWLWLDIAQMVLRKDPALAEPALAGRWAAARYFFHYELPRVSAWLQVVAQREMLCAQVEPEAF